ncbi:MAG: hypothetical protein U0599_05900 [Vicinamibacteria bacterium]
MVPLHVAAREAADVRPRPDDALPERVARELRAAREVPGVRLPSVLVVVLAHLLEHERALRLDVGEARPQDDVAEELEGVGQPLGRQAHVKDAQVAVGGAVERRAEGLDRLAHRARGPVARGAAEEHVLGHVRQAVLLRRLVARPGVEVQREGDGVQVRQRDGDDPQAVAEDGRLGPRVEAHRDPARTASVTGRGSRPAAAARPSGTSGS